MGESGFFRSLIMIAAILAIVFLSQQNYFYKFGNNFYSQAARQSGVYWSKLTNLLWPKISGEVEGVWNKIIVNFRTQKIR